MVNIMTLKISHGAFSGMCNEFHGWRCEVARAAGYGIEEQWGGDYIVLDWDAITDDNILGVWKTPATDPLLVLLAHSDTEGTIGPSEALRLADCLAELLVPGKWRAATEKFIAACRLAASQNKPMKFEWDPAATTQRLIEEHLREKLFREVVIPVARGGPERSLTLPWVGFWPHPIFWS
jgi:hypothetical protein